MAKLWEKGVPLDPDMLAFTTGDDPVLDSSLLIYDIMGSLAHLEAIFKAGVITGEQRKALRAALWEAKTAWEAGELTVTVESEDAHTALEEFLVSRAGETGKTIHAGRSRNDQALTMIRLYLRDALICLANRAIALADLFLSAAAEGEGIVIPGYTHHRQAMPSTWGLWAGAQAEGLLESICFSEMAFAMADRCPLGAGAGYGVPLPLDREETAERLGFDILQVNVLSTQASRGKDAVALLAVTAMYSQDLARIAADLIAFSDELTGFVKIPDAFTTGSSIMPHKKNPDVLEILRAKAAKVAGYLGQATNTVQALPSGYHRDLQTLKGPCMDAVDTVAQGLEICTKLVEGLEVDEQRAGAACRGELFATDEVYRRVRGGTPFREAYREVAGQVSEGRDFSPEDPLVLIKERSSLGAPGNLGLECLADELEDIGDRWAERAERIETALQNLWEDQREER